ncbi:hypothetical protein ASPBRDRAFT_42401 [Aspergillus brasiliensis CBS 101740]|uniref:Uncharacterized protein n=1 Tax=Aspergillus brasiliensis (strain CBS 101740 / IMI 381727 / IBT 21946) TaxID=767769 RepID=A0A1L9ULQ2_ASPBC|nr:hypothetical protein ASPBRDRAFT_42401 [Aspergillus brasiliensis CBS 101740]
MEEMESEDGEVIHVMPFRQLPSIQPDDGLADESSAAQATEPWDGTPQINPVCFLAVPQNQELMMVLDYPLYERRGIFRQGEEDDCSLGHVIYLL